MGERLAVNIDNGDDKIAVVYYHWGAYTTDALRITQRIVETLGDYESKSAEEMQLDLIKMCECDGGGIEFNDVEYISNKFKCNFKRDNISRNDGLIAISPEGIATVNQWATPIYINLCDMSVDNYVCDVFQSYQEYLEYCNDCGIDAESYDLITPISYRLDYFTFEELPTLYDELDNSDFVVKHENLIYTLIQ